MDRLLHQLEESRSQNLQLVHKLDYMMITNDSLKAKAKTVSVDAHAFVQLQLQKEFDVKKKLEKTIEAQKVENTALKSALNASKKSKQSLADENLELSKQLKQLNEQSENEKEINNKRIQDLKEKLRKAEQEVIYKSNNSKNIEANELAIENAASRFNKVNQLLKDTKWSLQVEKSKVNRLEDEVRELKAELLEDQGGDLQKIKFQQEIERLKDEIAKLKKELEDLRKVHKLELKQSYDKMLIMQGEWQRKENNLQSKFNKTKIEVQTEIIKLKRDLEEAQSANGGKLLSILKEDKKKWERASISYKGRIAVLVNALDEQVRKCKDLEDELALTKEALRKSYGLRHVDLENLTKDMRRKDGAGRLKFQKKLRKMMKREDEDDVAIKDITNGNPSNSLNLVTPTRMNSSSKENSVIHKVSSIYRSKMQFEVIHTEARYTTSKKKKKDSMAAIASVITPLNKWKNNAKLQVEKMKAQPNLSKNTSFDSQSNQSSSTEDGEVEESVEIVIAPKQPIEKSNNIKKLDTIGKLKKQEPKKESMTKDDFIYELNRLRELLKEKQWMWDLEKEKVKQLKEELYDVKHAPQA